MVSFTWEQINAWRLSQHHLLEPAQRQQFLQVVRDICGAHAQLMSAAELSLAVRVHDLSPGDVQNALWQERTLIKTWAMRGTLHLLAAEDFPIYVAALSTLRHFRRASWQKYCGITLAELEAIIEAAPSVLTDTGITREQLAEAFASHTNTPKLAELLRSGWGSILKPVAFQGHLGFGPSQGQNVTFVYPRRWLGDWTPVESQPALKEIARRYLNAYGPATIDEFARWFALEPSAAKKVFRSLGDELEEVKIENFKAWMLSSALKQIAAFQPSPSIRLLPHFDPYTVALARQYQYLMPEARKGRVYRSQGWIAPVVLVDGRIAGVWEQDKQRSRTTLKIEMFTPPTKAVKQGIEAQAERLGLFLDSPIEVSYQ